MLDAANLLHVEVEEPSQLEEALQVEEQLRLTVQVEVDES